MIYDKEKIFELGKSFDAGLVRFESLSNEGKYILSKYYALKNEELSNSIQNASIELTNINTHLDEMKNSFKL